MDNEIKTLFHPVGSIKHCRDKALEINPNAIKFQTAYACRKCGTYDRYIKSMRCCKCKADGVVKSFNRVHVIAGRHYSEKGKPRAKLNYENLEEIAHMYEHESMAMIAIAECFGVSYCAIQQFLAKKKHVKFWDERGATTSDIANVQNKALQLMARMVKL